MSEKYIPLYRKYRPQTFHDLIGQDHIKNALSNAINLGRISHAYLFCGPRGTGKTSSARILAKSLNCQEGPTLSPCGKCPSCVDIANSTPMDVIEIDAASNRGVDDTQKIIEKIHYVPVHGRYKIYVIDEVHQLSSSSFNALLKTLEEPPENVVFILATTEPHKVLETVISRCQRFDFKRITVNDIVARLKYIAQQENIKIEDDALLAIAKNSAGGMRDSLSLLDQVSILDVQKTITVEDIEALLGKISNDILFQITELILEHKTPECINLISEIYDKGNEPTQILTNLIQYLRNILVLKTFTDRDAVRNLTQLSDDYLKKMSAQAQQASENNFIFIIEKLNNYIKEVKLSSNPYMWLELCFMDLTTIDFDSYENILSRLEQLENGKVPAFAQKQAEPVLSIKRNTQKAESTEKKTETTNTEKNKEDLKTESTVVKEVPSEQVAPEPINQTQKNAEISSSAWDQILSNIDHTPSKVLFSTKSVPIELNEEKVVIAVQNEIFVKQAKDTTKFNALKKALEDYFKKPISNIEIRLKRDDDVVLDSSSSSKKKLTEKEEIVEKTNNSIEEKADEEYYNKLLSNTEKNDIQEDKSDKSNYNPAEMTDQANLVMELFNGKIIEET